MLPLLFFLARGTVSMLDRPIWLLTLAVAAGSVSGQQNQSIKIVQLETLLH